VAKSSKIRKLDSPEGSDPKLSTLQGFQMLPGNAPIVFKTLGSEKP
jgi:hypothetical protein